MKKRVKCRIVGRVQGVGFRAHTQIEARKLGLTGWVRNRNDGSVEALFEGKAHTVDQILKWCTDGSPHAKVTDITSEELPGSDPCHTEFDIHYDPQ